MSDNGLQMLMFPHQNNGGGSRRGTARCGL